MFSEYDWRRPISGRYWLKDFVDNGKEGPIWIYRQIWEQLELCGEGRELIDDGCCCAKAKGMGDLRSALEMIRLCKLQFDRLK